MPRSHVRRGSLLASSLSSTETSQSASASQGVPEPTDLNALIAEAGKDFADYQRLTAEGNLGEAGEKLEELKRVIDKLNAHRK